MSARLLVLLASLLASPVWVNAGVHAFAEHCADCHTLQPGRSKRGPALAGIIGKPAASVPNYRYSDAMRQAQIIWSRERLASFLANPRQNLPGTRMRMRKELAQQEMDALLTYLENSSQLEK